MFNNEIVNTIKPLIFTKKLNDNVKIIHLKKEKNTLGLMRYFPPVSQEWYNNIYAYNNLYIKNITIANKNLSRLIKSYFNLYFNKNLLYSKRVLTRFRRLAVNKVFISKAEVKHTSNKVIITLYIYNEERRALLNRIKRIENMLFPSFNFLSDEVLKKKILSLNEKFNIIQKEKENFSFWLEDIKNHMIEEINSEKKLLETINKLSLRSRKILEIKALEENVGNIFTIITACKHDPTCLNNYINIYSKFLGKTLLDKEIIAITYFKLLLNLNKSKFEDKFLLRLKPFIRKIYNKKVEFNIINLKSIYLNSNIFTQAIALKLRNRNNRLLTVLSYFLYMVKLPKVNLLKEQFAHINIKNLWINKIKNLISEPFYLSTKKDIINQLITGLFTDSNFLNKSEKKEPYYNYKKSKSNISSNLLDYIMNFLKYKSMAGVRLEAKGRLTRRFTASRSVFKIKWKGSLKNIDSSYKGLSSVILRGHVKSNVQYSIVNSKTRNGAFGLKGWISGK